MGCTRRSFVSLAGLMGSLGLTACEAQQAEQTETSASESSSAASAESSTKVDLDEFKDLELKTSGWSYDSANDCYYRLGLTYCLDPGSESLESLAIFVPGAYFKGTKKGKSYTCKINDEGTVGQYTAATAPIVMPVNSASFGSQSCPTAYGSDGLERYLGAGCVYVYAGFRGRSGGYESSNRKYFDGGAPWPVVDLKAAVRYLRYNKDVLPGNMDRIFAFGYGGGGGIASMLGASGDADLYTPYLESIGAVTHDGKKGKAISDAICGAASWCPVTSFDIGDASYEWMMGQFSSDGPRAEGTWTSLLSWDLAGEYGNWVNEMDLRDGDDEQLYLEQVEDGAYLGGSYYDYILGVISDSASDFFQMTGFPYTYTATAIADANFPGDPNRENQGVGEIASVTDTDAAQGGSGDADAEATTDESATEEDQESTGEGYESEDDEGTTLEAQAENRLASSGVREVSSTVYDSIESYVAELNGDGRWLSYSYSQQSAFITDLWDFVRTCRPAETNMLTFDNTDCSGTINQLFGVEDESSVHFDQLAEKLIEEKRDGYAAASGWSDDMATKWKSDMDLKDGLDVSLADRVNMMSPLYFLSGHYGGYGKAKVAPNWRINTGLFQNMTDLCMEANLVLALGHYEGVSEVSFTPVWGKGRELAEREGNAEENFVSWVKSCCPAGSNEDTTSEETTDSANE